MTLIQTLLDALTTIADGGEDPDILAREALDTYYGSGENPAQTESLPLHE